MKTLDNLVEDIYALFDPDIAHVANEDNLELFAESLKGVLRTRLAAREARGDGLRFSGLGKPDRQIWYGANPAEEHPEEAITAKTYFKFLYGDVIEALLLFLVKEAGHTVEMEQGEVEVDGVLGHIDALVDGVIVDVKSASSFGYKKFKQGTVTEDDPFGYVKQLSGYANVLTPGEPAAWIAMDKVTADICVSWLSPSIIRDHQPAPRIAHLKEVIVRAEPPPRCYDPIPDGKSGNMKLDTSCSYCAFKLRCHPTLRTFLYSTGPRFLTSVSKLPDVREVIIGAAEPEMTD